ncbi:YbgF trimerization domain-containing protein [Marinimicrobium sp. ABcell2]|uniref:YbgF trimerization domain-containing protein n=1 Tax=Marinimicrobium sp. ABcell2 TaxID=3069751 RepID=UPI0027B2384B|nr:YbgF trimerization domain-containing protein [Marinimicrobium sp. ABcell2]MDQ2077896.1 YbgF trimerization domain-containing protein [Marinimicrobium sp. ABcell2]
MYKLMLAAAVIAAAPVLEAQVRVEESRPLVRTGVANTNAPSDDAQNIQMELFFQLQALQEEVQMLRGMVEEQSHEINRLQQQRMDDYLDLDRRLSLLTEGARSSSRGDANGSAQRSGSSAPSQGSTAGSNAETEAYRAAYQLLRDRNVDEAIEAFNAYLERYPKGNFAGNSYYWLGEIFLLKDDLEKSQEWFSRLLKDFPRDRKVSDTKFKLGTVYHRMGNNSRAQELLQEVAGDGSDASRLARRYLQENF